MKRKLTIELLRKEAGFFAQIESETSEPSLFGVTDGKAVGTYLEHKFQAYLHEKYSYVEGSSAKGIDFPELEVDMKVTSIKQPQSSCPFKAAEQKIFGLGYSLLVFVYKKTDDEKMHTAKLNILHVIYIAKERTADYQTTTGILKILENNGNVDDIIAFMHERMLPVDEIKAEQVARNLLNDQPAIGYLTISNALQWRLQYRRAIEEAGKIEGVHKVK
ncbi:restriction endonuclease [Planctomycetota bacterium]